MEEGKTFTSAELRERAELIDCNSHCGDDGVWHVDEDTDIGVGEVVAMLRQAADMRERLDAVNRAVDGELKKQARCRCCEWRGKTIRSEPACPCDGDVHGVVFDIDVTDRIVNALRGDAWKEER